MRLRKRAKERARRAKEKISKLAAQGLLLDGELDDEEMPDMKPVPGQGLKLSLNASRIKAAAQRSHSTPGSGQPRKKQVYKPRPAKPLWIQLSDLTEIVIKNRQFGQVFGDAGTFRRLHELYRNTGGFEHDPQESARKRVRHRHGMVRGYCSD